MIFAPYAWDPPTHLLSLSINETVAFHLCSDPHDYESSLFNLWNIKDNLIVVEHDIEPTQSNIESLLSCPSQLCAFAYLVYPVSSGLQTPVIPHSHRKDGKYIFLTEGETEADHAALGLTKFGQYVRKAVKRSDLLHDEWSSWRNLDIRLSQAFNDKGLRFHIHWPIVQHNHKENR